MGKILSKHSLKYGTVVKVLVALCVIALAGLIVGLRYKAAFQFPNFYAEDGTVFLHHTIYEGVLPSLFTSFDGYLVFGQYMLTNIAVVLHQLLGLPFYSLATVVAIVSCAFFGLTVALPYLLFRKELGTLRALATVVLGACVALPGSDYAVIGTIGNLKFIFMYWAVLLIIYRNLHARSVKRVVAVDIALLICSLTNITVVLILPFALWPYRNDFKKIWQKKQFGKLSQTYIVSALGLLAVMGGYVLFTLIKGIPELPGYLDTAYRWRATGGIIFRSTWYGWLHPITTTMNDVLSVSLLLGFVYWGLKKAENRTVTLLCLWAIFVASFSFVFHRPGVSDFLITYQLVADSPDQFFYTQSLIFIFATMWLTRSVRLDTLRRGAIFVGVVGLYLWWSVPFGSSFGDHYVGYREIGTAYDNVQIACKTDGKDVVLALYPNTAWHWTLSREEVCAK